MGERRGASRGAAPGGGRISAGRVCRVVADLTAVERVFDYSVPEALAASVRVGTIVRVPLHGRKVRGWVVEDDVVAAVADPLALTGIVSAGPPAPVIELTAWVAHRWAGPRVAVLRSASPPNNVPANDRASVKLALRASQTPDQRVVRVPPLRDRREIVEGMLAPAGSTIVCVADGARAQSLARWLARDGGRVALFHSDASHAQRTDAWRRASAGACVVVGGRIAALAPVPDLAAVVVVDDADEALQEERVPTWHARDVLRERAARAGAAFTVLSAVPTLEAIVAAGGAVEAPSPDVERLGWPRVQVIDRRREPPGARLLTEPLVAALRDAHGLAVCVVNRRGRFRLLACDACHELLRWDKADERPLVCAACGATRLRVLRAGVTRLREELEALLPGRRVVDVDTETGEVPDADVLVGTEAVLHRVEVRRRHPVLVAYLDFDQELCAPRYRASAQALLLLTRGAQLLAARPRAETFLLVQTRVPDHLVVRAVAEGRPTLVEDCERAERLALGYPPFGALAELSGDDGALRATVDALRAAGTDVLGPSDGRALVRAAGGDDLAAALARALPVGRGIGRVRCAVDPPRV